MSSEAITVSNSSECFESSTINRIFSGKSMLNDLAIFDVKEKSWVRGVSTGSPPPPR